MPVIEANTLFYGDNLPILREYIATESVDLVYLDPPFNSNRSYNVLFKDESGTEADAQIEAFGDTWHWNQHTAAAYESIITTAPTEVSTLIGALRQAIGMNQMMAYLVMMAARLIELHRVLKPTGSLYLHCDPTASHYLKIVLDAIFDARNYRNEITWQRTFAHGNVGRNYGSVADVILFYSKSEAYTWQQPFAQLTDAETAEKYPHVDPDGRRWQSVTLRNPGVRPNLHYPYTASNGVTYQPHPNGWSCNLARMQQYDHEGRLHFPGKQDGALRLKMYADESKGERLQNIWTDIPPIGAQAAERLGYPTQKPLALLERIIQASSNEGDVVLDPFCGCGTAIAAAQKLNRRWIGIDITSLAIALIKNRLKDMYGAVNFKVIGEPEDLSSAIQLSQDDRYQFQWWALSLISARPLGGQEGSKTGKKGSDKGIDGVITFLDDNSGKPKRVLVQVKSGKVKSGDVRDLVGTVNRENAVMGIFITLEEPTRDMLTEAASAGFYKSEGWQRDYPKVQILTVEALLRGAEVKLPPTMTTFKQAPRVKGEAGQQGLFGELE
jgi:site-specific DNA-methyltransferase (adenine-specific)